MTSNQDNKEIQNTNLLIEKKQEAAKSPSLHRTQKLSWKSRGFRNGVLIVLAVTVLNVSLYSIVTSHKYNIRSLTDPKPEITEIKSKPKARKKLAVSIPEVSSEITVPEIMPVKESTLFKGDYVVSFMNGDSPIEVAFVRDNVSRMTIDGENIPRNEFDDYAVLIEEARLIVAEKNGEEILKPEENNKKTIMNRLIEELVADDLIIEGGHFHFLLSGVELKINDVVQKNNVFLKYHALYKELSGIDLKGKSNIKIKH
jgi:hypothetical protein